MRTLVVNADDLGADDARNAGIFEGVEAGAVTSVSVLANGPALADAAHRLQTPASKAVSLGIHLNLSEGRPLSHGLHLLADPDGFFPGKARARDLLMSTSAELDAEIEAEIEAQIKHLEELLGPLDHLDGHQHVHVFPAVRNAALRAAERHGIRWVRVPDEHWPSAAEAALPARLSAEAALFVGCGREARVSLAGSTARAPDHFRGLFLRAGPLPEGLFRLVRSLPDGLTELMVHPGRPHRGAPPGPFSAFSTAGREQELEALLSSAFRRALEDVGAVLAPFPSRAPDTLCPSPCCGS